MYGLLAIVLTVSLQVFGPTAASYAAEECVGTSIQCGMQATQQTDNSGDAVGPTDLSQIIKTVINILLFVIGALSVIMLIWGGIRYTTSGGNQNSVTAAKNTILYAIIGLVVAILAYAIVNWVIGSLAGGTED